MKPVATLESARAASSLQDRLFVTLVAVGLLCAACSGSASTGTESSTADTSPAETATADADALSLPVDSSLDSGALDAAAPDGEAVDVVPDSSLDTSSDETSGSDSVIDADSAAASDASPGADATIGIDNLIYLDGVPVAIELTWNTPGDPDQSDTGPAAGADLDLHLAHPGAAEPDIDGDGQPDPWFSNPFDVFWFNSAPAWFDSAWSSADPTMAMDDPDGMGPELIVLASPPPGALGMELGVHYWTDHGYGDSEATVTVYVYNIPVFQASKWLKHRDMWHVGRLDWEVAPQPTGGATFWPCQGKACLTACYSNTTFDAAMGGNVPSCP